MSIETSVTIAISTRFYIEEFNERMTKIENDAYKRIVIQKKDDKNAIEILREFVKRIADEGFQGSPPDPVITESDILSLVE